MPAIFVKLGAWAVGAGLKYLLAGAVFAALLVGLRMVINHYEDAIEGRAVAELQRDHLIGVANDTAMAWAQARADAAHNELVAADVRQKLDTSNQAVTALRTRLAAKAAQPGGDAPMTPALRDALDAWRSAVKGAAP